MATDHPFQQLFETFGKLAKAHAEKVNLKAREAIKERLSVDLEKGGHCILLKAPRAGHGKTHLLTRLQRELGGSHEFIPIYPLGGSRIDALTVTDDILGSLLRSLPASGGLTVLDLVARSLFSSALQPLVRSGEVPCHDRDGALRALRTRPVETFDFHHPNAVTAHWALENFEQLGPRLSSELSEKNGLSFREVSFWVNALFVFASTPTDNRDRVRALMSTVSEGPLADGDSHGRVVTLLGLMTSMTRVVLVADELEGFSSDETAALRFASFICTLRQSVNRLDVIISINQDVWSSAFLPRLSAGLADRISEVVVELQPLERDEKIAILDSRLPGMGVRILNQLDGESIPSYARGLVRKAAEKFENGELQEKRGELLVLQGGPSPKRVDPPSPPAEFKPDSPKAPVKQDSDFGESVDFASPLDKPQAERVGPGIPTSPREESEAVFTAPASQTISRSAPVVSPGEFSELPEVEIPSAPVKEAPAEASDRIPDSGFQTAVPKESSTLQPEEGFVKEEVQPASVPQSQLAAEPQPVAEQPETTEEKQDAKSDRVDVLLREFRERYGKS